VEARRLTTRAIFIHCNTQQDTATYCNTLIETQCNTGGGEDVDDLSEIHSEATDFGAVGERVGEDFGASMSRSVRFEVRFGVRFRVRIWWVFSFIRVEGFCFKVVFRVRLGCFLGCVRV